MTFKLYEMSNHVKYGIYWRKYFKMLRINNFIIIQGGQVSCVDTVCQEWQAKHKKKHVEVFFSLLFFMSVCSSKTHYQEKYRIHYDTLISLCFFLLLHLMITCVVASMGYIVGSERISWPVKHRSQSL